MIASVVFIMIGCDAAGFCVHMDDAFVVLGLCLWMIVAF